MSPVYSEQFKLKMIRQMVGPHAKSGVQVAAETGVGATTLSRWVAEANSLGPVPKNGRGKRSELWGKMVPTNKRTEDWTPEEKMHAVLQASALSDEELGAFLRETGLHQIHLDEWRETVLESLGKHPRAKKQSESKRVKQLERELRRKEKALAETAALLVLKKKVQEIWGDEDDDTEPKSGK